MTYDLVIGVRAAVLSSQMQDKYNSRIGLGTCSKYDFLFIYFMENNCLVDHPLQICKIRFLVKWQNKMTGNIEN